MSRIAWSLAGGLTTQQIQSLHEQALDVLATIGLDISHEPTLRILAEHDGVTIRGARAHFAADVVNRCTLKRPYTPPADTALTAGAGVYCLNVMDYDGTIRPATTGDAVRMVKLADALDFSGETPVEPQDIPPRLRQVAMTKICWENSRRLSGGYLYDPEPAEFVYEMAQAAGRTFALGGTVIISPLKVDPAKLDLFLRFRDRGVRVNFSAMPMVGATAPIFFPAAIVQALAEFLGGVVLSCLVFGGDPSPGIINLYPYDLRHNTVSFGSAEKLLLMLSAMQIANYFGFDIGPNALMGTARAPDAQAGAEKLSQVMVTALAGARHFRYAGSLSQDEIFSPVQLVIDREIVDFVARVLRGYDVGPQEQFLDIIAQGVADGGFLAHPATLEHFRDTYWFPPLFDHQSLGAWREAGQPSVADRARAIAEKKLADHQFALPAEVARDLNNIYRRAQQQLT
ncbi:MAG: hypothetical protein GXY33_04765 [Phycisphaerae bacterium]|nr:hypothetical protein [Phycisphaerae bacterium]